MKDTKTDNRKSVQTGLGDALTPMLGGNITTLDGRRTVSLDRH